MCISLSEFHVVLCVSDGSAVVMSVALHCVILCVSLALGACYGVYEALGRLTHTHTHTLTLRRLSLPADSQESRESYEGKCS